LFADTFSINWIKSINTLFYFIFVFVLHSHFSRFSRYRGTIPTTRTSTSYSGTLLRIPRRPKSLELCKGWPLKTKIIYFLPFLFTYLKDNALISHYFKTAFNLKWRYDSPCNVPPCNVSKVLFEIICFLFSPIYQSVAFEHKLRRLRRLEEADRGQSTTKRTW
jgi:hypothetical protein